MQKDGYLLRPDRNLVVRLKKGEKAYLGEKDEIPGDIATIGNGTILAKKGETEFGLWYEGLAYPMRVFSYSSQEEAERIIEKYFASA